MEAPESKSRSSGKIRGSGAGQGRPATNELRPLATSPRRGPGPDARRAAEAQHRAGVRAEGGRGAGGRSPSSRPARRAVRPAHPERGGAGAQRSGRRRGRCRLQEPLETESPAAAAAVVAAGPALRKASERPAAGAGAQSVPVGSGAQLGAAAREFGCWEARWREGTEEGRKEGGKSVPEGGDWSGH